MILAICSHVESEKRPPRGRWQSRVNYSERELLPLFSFEGFVDNRDEIGKIVGFVQHGHNSRLMGLLPHLVSHIPRIKNKGNGVKIRPGFHLLREIPDRS